MYLTGSVPSGNSLRRALHKWALTVAVASGLAVGTAVHAKAPNSPELAAVVALSGLPGPAQATHRLILAGGPFPYNKDGTVFGNREQHLPAKARGHYREYTVKTPGSRDRGARRIVCGGQPPTQPEACFYTDDHYASFKKIAP